MSTVERSRELAARSSGLRSTAGTALRRPANWVQLLQFCVVGASGYVVNLGVYSLLVHGLSVNYLAAAVCSFAVAVTNNYLWNRLWTFRAQRGHVGLQGAKFLAVSLVALGANVGVLAILVEAGMAKVPAQAVAIVVVTPLSFLGNKLWSFRS